MKTLLVLRHAKSSWNDSTLADHDRPLNARGERDAPRIGRLLRQLVLAPDTIIASDAVRTKMTAEAVAATALFAGEIRLEHLLYLAAWDDILVVLRAVEPNPDTVLIVGHNPGLEGLVRQLTGQQHDLPTAALAQIALPIDRWRDLGEFTRGTLVGIWRPSELD